MPLADAVRAVDDVQLAGADRAVDDVQLDVPGALSVLRLRGMDLSGHRGGSSSAAKELASLIGRVPLVVIDLKNCHITDAVAETLAIAFPSAPGLMSLQLSRTDDSCSIGPSCQCGIKAKGAQALCSSLATLPCLRELDLCRHDLRDEGAAAVATLLTTSTSLTALGLSDNGIGEAGALSISGAIATTTSPLDALALSDNPLGEGGLRALCTALSTHAPRSLRALELAMDRQTALCTRPSKLMGRALPDVAAAALASLLASTGAASLTSLDLSGTFELGSSSRGIPSSPPSASSAAGGGGGGGEGGSVHCSTAAGALRSLWDAIAAHPALTRLECRLAPPLSKAAASEKLVECMQTPLLERLLPGPATSGAGAPGGGGLERSGQGPVALFPLPSGPCLDRKLMQRRYADAAQAASSGPLDRLFAPAPTFPTAPRLLPALTSALGRAANLTALHLHATLDKAGAAALAAALRSNVSAHASALRLLDLRFSKLGAAVGGLDALGEALCCLCSAPRGCRLQTLDLSFCAIKAWPTAMRCYCRSDTALRALELRFNQLRGAGVAAVIDCLTRHPSLARLGLRRSTLQPRAAAKALARLAALAAPLEALELRNNKLGARAVHVLLSALSAGHDSSDFGGTSEGSGGAAAFVPGGEAGGGAWAVSGRGEGGRQEDREAEGDVMQEDDEASEGKEDEEDDEDDKKEEEEEGSHAQQPPSPPVDDDGSQTTLPLHAYALQPGALPGGASVPAATSLVARAAAARPRLQWLSLRLCGIKSSGARAVAAWLTTESARDVHTLHMDQNPIGGKGARAFALALEQRSSGLPPGWFSSTDDATGRPFYFRLDITSNKAVDGSQWEPPGGPHAALAGTAGDAAQPLRELGLGFCELGDASVAAVLDALTKSAAPPPSSLRIGGNTLQVKAIKSLGALLERGGVISLDLKRARLEEDSARWLAPLADALQGHTPRRPRLRWPLGGWLGCEAGGHRAVVEPLLVG